MVNPAGSETLDLFTMKNFIRTASEQSVQVSIRVEKPTSVDSCQQAENENVVILGFNFVSISMLEKYLHCKRRADSIVVIKDKKDNESSISSGLDSMVKSLGHSRSFHVIEGSTLYHILTFRNQSILADHQYNCFGHRCKKLFEEYDFKGAKLVGSTMSWEPWLNLDQCGTVGQLCRTSGILSDLMDIMAHKFNFTLELSKADNWGLLPTSGSWQDSNATFSGVWGTIAHDEQDLPLSVWTLNYERSYWADMLTPFYDRPMLIVINKQIQSVDLTFLFRPFTSYSWAGVLVTLAMVVCCILLPRQAIPSWKDSWASHRIFVISGWLLFILVNSFYGGALTMFFTHAPSFPFNNMREGVALWPEWKMVTVIGNEYNINTLLSEMPEAKSYLDFLNTEEGRNELILKDYKAALQTLIKPGYFLFESEKLALTQAIR